MNDRNPHDELIERYVANSHAYLDVAKLALANNRDDALIAPCCYNLAVSIELMLKSCFLAKEGGSESKLKSYGHDILHMWKQDWAVAVRDCAEREASRHVGKIVAKWGIPAKQSGLTPACELTRNLEWLAEGYGADLKFALRYPPANIRVTVPSPEFLIPVFENVLSTLSPGFGRSPKAER